MTIAPINLMHRKVAYTVKPDFATAPDMLNGMVERIKVKTRYLAATTGGSSHMIAMQYREIRGMIALFESVCDASALHTALVDHLLEARLTADEKIPK